MPGGERPDWNGSSVTPAILDELFPVTQAWRDAVRNAWLLAGGDEEAAARLFGPNYAKASISPTTE